MRTAGLTMNDVWADRVLQEQGVVTHRFAAVPAEIGVLVHSAQLSHHGPELNFRPYLHLGGELRSIVPEENLSFGISEVFFTPGKGDRVDVFYEFDDEQLVVLANKGYFTKQFAVPQEITGIQWELPVLVDALVLAPDPQADNAPVAFTRVHNIADISINLQNSGYDLTEYFSDFSRDPVLADPSLGAEHERYEAMPMDSLFSEDELNVNVGTSTIENKEADRIEDVAEMMLRDVEAQIESERAIFERELQNTDGTPENLYYTRVAPGADAAWLSDDAEPAQAPSTPAEAVAETGDDLEVTEDTAELFEPEDELDLGDTHTPANTSDAAHRRDRSNRGTEYLDFSDDEDEKEAQPASAAGPDFGG